MKFIHMKYLKLSLILTFLPVIIAYGQNSEIPKSTSYAIGYTSLETGNIEIYSGDIEGKLTSKSTNENGGYVAWSPDGKRIAFYSKYDEKKTWSIHTMNSDGRDRKRLTHVKNKWDNAPDWSPDGTKIVFARAYKDSESVWQHEIWIMNSDGSEQTQIKGLKGSNPYFTPDGRIVFSQEFEDKSNAISIADVDGNNIIRLTNNKGAQEWHPDVSPNGKQIAFMSDKDGNFEIYVMDIDGSNQKRLTYNDARDSMPSWSPDGSQLIFHTKMGENRNVYMMNKDGSSVKKIISNGAQAAWSKIAPASIAQQSHSRAPVATAAEAELSFRDIPYLKKAFIDVTPADRKDGISVGELGVDGGNKTMILKLAQDIADNNEDKFDSFHIVYKDKLLFESYYLRGRIDLPHFQASATKAYTSMALGRAIQFGYLTMADLDKPLVSFLKELDPTKFVGGVELITLHKALTMSTGIRIPEEQWEEFRKDPSKIKGQLQVQAILEHSAPITPASQHFLYGTGPGLIMQVLEAVVPGSAKDFIKNELLDKMGITNYVWRTQPSGLPEAGWRTNMTSRDMVKWGTLAMNKGKWNGEQLVPEAFLGKATSRILLTGDDDVYGGGKDVSNQGYGYYWWSADLKHGDKSYFSRSAQGGGGQYIILIEELDLMIVVTAHNNDNRTLQIIAERILPAFIKK